MWFWQFVFCPPCWCRSERHQHGGAIHFLLKKEFMKLLISLQKKLFWAQDFLGLWSFTCFLQIYTWILLRDVKSADILVPRWVTPISKWHTFLTKDWVVKMSISSQQKLILTQNFAELHSFMRSFERMIFDFTQGTGNFSMT